MSVCVCLLCVCVFVCLCACMCCVFMYLLVMCAACLQSQFAELSPTNRIYVSDYGGIYLDTDMLILKSLDPLRVHALTLGVSGPKEISNAIIIAQKNALFLRLWKENYKNYKPAIWGHNSVTFGRKLFLLFPHLVHVEKEHLLQPTWKEVHLLYSLRGEFYNWSQSYSVHVSGEGKYRVPRTVEQLKGYNNTLGEVMRYIYFGSRKLLPVKGAPFTPK